MLLSYLTIAWRNIAKNRISTTINVLGLSLGMTAFILIMQYVSFEKSVNKFHANLPELYRVLYEVSYTGHTFTWESISPVVATMAKDQLGEVKDYCRIASGSSNGIVTYEDPAGKSAAKTFREDHCAYADGSFFSMFTFDVAEGDPKSLANANTVAISKSVALKYFEKQNAIGKVLVFNNQFGKTLYTVTAVFNDLPENSDIRYNLIFSLATLANPANLNGSDWADLSNINTQWIETFLLVNPGTNKASLEAKLNQGFKKINPKAEELIRVQSMANIHLPESLSDTLTTSGTLKFLYILEGIAVLILVIAWFNYINLSTAGALKRAKEVGIRKVVGAGKIQLVKQFMGESFLMNFAALICSLALVNLVQPLYNGIIGKDLSLLTLHLDSAWTAGLMIVIFGVAASTTYTAFSLAAFKPSETLKGTFIKSGKGIFLRKTLVVFQFTVSILLIGSTFILFRQMQYMRNENLGFKLDQLVVLAEPEIGVDSTRKQHSQAFLNDLANQNFVSGYCMSGTVPGRSYNYNSPGITRLNPEPGDEKINYGFTFIDDRFIDVYGMTMASGKSFTQEMCSAPFLQRHEVILNEKASTLLGFESPEKAIGQKVVYNGRESEVLGVIKDYHHNSLQNAIDPVVFFPANNPHYFTVRLSADNMQSHMKTLGDLYQKDFPGNPFDYFFADEKYDLQYQNEQRYSTIFSMASVLAIFIACLGLLGLAMFTVEQRVKEVGIRKVLGASVPQITTLLSRDFFSLVLIAFIIATPISWYVMNQWLQEFAYRVQISWWIYGISGVMALTIAVITVSSQAIRAALSNPVESLRNE